MTDLRSIDLGIAAEAVRPGAVTTLAATNDAVLAAERERQELEATQRLLAEAGLDRVPTIEEAKALLEARRAEIRQAVLDQADVRDWCYDGTRKVCANLRLAKPDDRKQFTFTAKIEVEVEVSHTGFTEAGAVKRLQRAYGDGTNRPLLSAAWFQRYLSGGVKVIKVTGGPLDLGNGDTFPIGDPKTEIQEEAR